MQKSLRTRLCVSWLVLMPATALAQFGVTVAFPVPTVRFEVAPPLVVVEPGVQVVEDHDEEIFFVDGWYWLRGEQAWYRSRDHRGHWVVVGPKMVPARLLKFPPGHYRHWKRVQAKGPNEGHHGKGKHH